MRGNRIFSASSRLFVLFYAAVAGAATMDEVVVSSTRIESPIFEAPQAVSRIDREEILQGNYRTSPEALMQSAGITVQKTAHGHGSPFIRGLTGKEVLILIDGVRLNNSTYRFGPNQYLNTIDPALIDHIEVTRGPGSVLYGSDALGGVINIITRKREDFSQAADTAGELNLVYGSADAEKTGRGTFEGNNSSFGYLLGAGYRDFDNLEAGGDIGEQLYTGYSEYHANATLSLQGGADSRTDLSLQTTHQNNVPRTDKFTDSNESQIFDPQERAAMALHWQGKPAFAFIDHVTAGLSYQQQHEELYQQKLTSTLVKHYDDSVQTLGLNVQAETLSGSRHLLVYGLEYYQDSVDSSRTDTNAGVTTAKQGNFPDGSEYRMSGVFLQDEIAVSPQSKLIAGIRYSSDQVKTDLSSFGYGMFEDTYEDVTASLNWSNQVSEGVRYFAGVAQGFRAPNLDDIAVLKSTNEGVDIPSPGLKSEKSINYELGFKLNRPQWQGTFVVFRSNYTDLIDRRASTYLGLSFIDDNSNGIQDAGEDNVVQKFNVGNASIWGMEMDSRWILDDVWSLFGNLSWSYGVNKTADEPVSRIPPARLLFGARWAPAGNAWFAEPFAEVVNSQHRLSARDVSDPRILAGGTPGYATLNLRSGREGQTQSFYLTFNNLADRQYKVHGSGLYGPGREVKLSYLYHF